MHDYVGISHLDGGLDRDGIDCYGLVRLAYMEQLGIELPTYAAQLQGSAAIAEEIARQKEHWLQVEFARPFDVLLLRMRGEEKHLALVTIPGEMLHSLRGVGVVRERYDTGKWRHRVEGIYRYSGSTAPVVINGNSHPMRTVRIETAVLPGASLLAMIEQTRVQAGCKAAGRGVAWVDGNRVPQELWADTVPAPGSLVEFRLVPGDGDVGRIVGMFAVMAASWWTGGAVGALFAGSTAASLAGGLASAGMMFAGSMLVNSIFPVRPQSAPAAAGNSASQAILTGSQNVVTKFGAYPVVLGRVRYAPPLAANSYSETTASTSYLRMALCWGPGPLHIEDITLGDTDIDTFEECELQTLSGKGWPTDGAKKRFNELYGARDVSQILVNQELVVDRDNDPVWIEHTMPSPIDRMTITLHFPEGLRAIANSGDHAGESFHRNFRAMVQYRRLDSETLEPVGDWIIPTGIPEGSTSLIAADEIELSAAWHTSVIDQVKYGRAAWRKVTLSALASGAIIKRSSPIAHTEGETSVPATPTTEVPLWRLTVSGDSVVAQEDMRGSSVTGCALTIDGLSVIIAEGEIVSTDVNAAYKVAIGDVGEDWAKEKDAFSINVEQKFSVTAPYMVRLKRTSVSGPREYTAPGGTRFTRCATCQWLFITGYRNAKPITPPVPLAMTAIRIKATDQLDGTADAVTGIATSVCLDYDADTETWVKRPTSNPASLYRYVRQHPCNAKRCANRGLDLTTLEDWHTYCANAGFTYNALVTDFSSVQEVCKDICAAGRATPWKSGDGKWSVIVDKPRSGYAQLLTPHNSWGFEGVLSLPTLPHAFRCKFRNENANWAEDELIVYADGYSASTATIFEQIEFPGVTDPATIVKHARFHLGQLRLRPEKYALYVDFEHLLCTRGDLVRCVHDVPMWGVCSGRIKNMLSPTSLELDNDVPMNAGDTYAITIRRSDTGALVERLIAAKPSDGYYRTITLSSPVSSDEGAPGNLVSIGGGTDLVVENIEMLDQMTARLTLVDYAPALYDLDDGEIPEHETNITMPQDIDVAPITAKPTIISLISDERAMTKPKGSTAYGIMVGVSHPSSLPRRVTGFAVQYRRAGAKQWRNLPTVPLAAVSHITGLTENDAYEVRARYVSRLGDSGPWCSLVTHTVRGRINPPPRVTGLRVENGALVWAYSAAPMDLAGFEVRCAYGAIDNWDSCERVRDGRTTATTFAIDDYISNRQRTWMVKAYDTAGNYSIKPAILVTAAWELIASDPPPRNQIYTYDLQALGWPGVKNNCSIVGSSLAANDTTAFWGELDEPFWGDSENPFWATNYSRMAYTFTWRPDETLIGLDLVEAIDTTATIENILYSVGSLDPFWLDDEEPFWGDVEAPFWGEPKWSVLPKRLKNIKDFQYKFKVQLRDSASVSAITACALVVDVPDKSESVEVSVAATGTRVPLQKSYRAIKYVQATLIDDGGNAVRCKVLDKSTSGPMIACYDIIADLCTGKVHVTITGY